MERWPVRKSYKRTIGEPQIESDQINVWWWYVCVSADCVVYIVMLFLILSLSVMYTVRFWYICGTIYYCISNLPRFCTLVILSSTLQLSI